MQLDTNRVKTSPKNIRVVFITTSLTTGGAEMMLYKFLSRIDRQKFSPTVISMISGGVFVERVKALDIPVHDLGMQQGVPSLSALRKLNRLLNEIKPDLIQGWMYHANLISYVANILSKRKVPLIWSIHHSIDSLKAEKLSLAAVIKMTALFSSQVDTVVVSAKKGLKQHINIGYNPHNAIAISDNFDLSRYKPIDEPSNLRQTLNLPEDAILIGSVARYHPMKDHANLIDAAAEIVKDYPNLHFVTIGPSVDVQNAALTEQIERLGIAERIHLLGERQDIPSLMTSFDIFTSSSAYGESFPNVLGEAMSCQVPCVATDIGDSQAIIGDTGIVVPPRDPQALATAWRKLVDLSREERHELGLKARKRIQDNFNLDSSNSFVRKYESIYQVAVASE